MKKGASGISLASFAAALMTITVGICSWYITTSSAKNSNPIEPEDEGSPVKIQGLQDIALNEETLKKLTAQFKGEVYDLSDENDLKKWRMHFQDINMPDKEKIQQSDRILPPSTVELAVDSPRPTEPADHPKDPKITEKIFNGKARTDINIHDPQKPIPSILSYPLYDKNGVPLKRIFIPGRGWCSAKQIEKERQELLRSFISPIKMDNTVSTLDVATETENLMLDY